MGEFDPSLPSRHGHVGGVLYGALSVEMGMKYVRFRTREQDSCVLVLGKDRSGRVCSADSSESVSREKRWDCLPLRCATRTLVHQSWLVFGLGGVERGGTGPVVYIEEVGLSSGFAMERWRTDEGGAREDTQLGTERDPQDLC
jgi:hypothetical protein